MLHASARFLPSVFLIGYCRVTHTLPQVQTPTMSAPPHRGGDVMLPIHFFKIIPNTNLKRLKIPNEFTRRHGDDLPNPVFLKPPDGTQWKLYWTKENGEVWFQKGWKEFSENYSLDQGHLVLFTYDGTSQFDVIILDKSALETDYPICNNCDDGEKNKLDHESEDESVQFLKDRQMAPSCSPRPHTKVRDEKASQRTSSLNWPKEPRAQEVAQKFISCHPFFTMFIKPVHLIHYKAAIPSNLKGYYIESETKNVKLRIGKRSWDVKLSHCYSHSDRRFSAGWLAFVNESELQPEDVCIFELISIENAVFEVHVFKKA